MSSGLIGQLCTPASGNRVVPGAKWAADNAVYADKYPGDDEYVAWLLARDLTDCLWAAAPDVLYDAAATVERSLPMLARIRELGIPAALVAQDGLEFLPIPWDAFDVLFLGGTTEWKLGPAARLLTAQAKRRGKQVHMGRVNSERRFRYASLIDCDTADGTFLAFGPDENLPKLLAWQRGDAQLTFGGAA